MLHYTPSRHDLQETQNSKVYCQSPDLKFYDVIFKFDEGNGTVSAAIRAAFTGF